MSIKLSYFPTDILEYLLFFDYNFRYLNTNFYELYKNLLRIKLK